MKNKDVRINSPEDLNKHLQHSSPITWIILTLVTAMLAAFFAWSCIYKLTIKIMGKADVVSGEATLHINESDLDKLKVGQKVYINNLEGQILSINDDKQPEVSTFDLEDGTYTYKVIIGQKRPIDFLISK